MCDWFRHRSPSVRQCECEGGARTPGPAYNDLSSTAADRGMLVGQMLNLSIYNLASSINTMVFGSNKFRIRRYDGRFLNFK